MRHSPISHLLGNDSVPPSLIVWVASFISHSTSMLRTYKRQIEVTRKAIREQARRTRAKPKKITIPNFRISQRLNRLNAADPHLYPSRWRKSARATCITLQNATRFYSKALQTLLREHDRLFRSGPSRKNLNRQSIIPVLPKQWKNTQKGEPHVDL